MQAGKSEKEKKNGTTNLIEFKAGSDMIEPKEGKTRVEFVFYCYPKDHRLFVSCIGPVPPPLVNHSVVPKLPQE